ncbi:MAG: hypothetical protein ACE5IE_02965 [Dehalococcoidia bacterium]
MTDNKYGDGIVKKRELAREELDKVIKLKQIGTSWLKIEQETGISRRTAKRAYEKWEHSQSPEVLREARKDVAAKAFLDHLKSLTTLAGSVVTNLSVPSSIADMEKNAEQFFAWLWQQNLLWRGVYASHEPLERYNLAQLHVYTMGDAQCFLMGDPQFNVLENQLLFKCLQDHTRGEGVRWGALDEWEKARDNCAKIAPELRKETSEVVNNFLNQERQTNLLRSIKEGSGEDDPAKQMAEVVLRELWRSILQDKLDEEGPWFQTVLHGKGIPQEINVKSGDETVFRFFGDTNMSLAEKVTRICELAAKNLRKGDMVQQLYREVRDMKKASEELREMLNPVKLTPMIIRTRCDLCPA